jgi:UDP-galactopyranose mutase
MSRCENLKHKATDDNLTTFQADQMGSDGNNSIMYIAGCRLISRPGTRLSSLQYFVAFLNPTEKSWDSTPLPLPSKKMKRVKLSLCLTKNYAKKRYGGVDVY